MADETKNIFISHIHEDDEGLGKLKSLLKDNGMTPRDRSGLPIRSILAPRIRKVSCLITRN